MENFVGDIHYNYGEASLSVIPNTIDPAIAIHLFNLIMSKEDAALAFLLNKTGKVSKKVPVSVVLPIMDWDTGETTEQTIDMNVTMNNNVLSIDCGPEALMNAYIPKVEITYEK